MQYRSNTRSLTGHGHQQRKSSVSRRHSGNSSDCSVSARSKCANVISSLSVSYAAMRAASMTSASISAATAPAVSVAIVSSSICVRSLGRSASSVLRISIRPDSFGVPISSFRSIRPLRIAAESKSSNRFVAPINNTFVSVVSLSCESSSLTTFRFSSCIRPSRAGRTLSSSSTKMIAPPFVSAIDRASENSCLISCGLLFIHSLVISAPLRRAVGYESSFESARARCVFPVPGGPYNKRLGRGIENFSVRSRSPVSGVIMSLSSFAMISENPPTISIVTAVSCVHAKVCSRFRPVLG